MNIDKASSRKAKAISYLTCTQSQESKSGVSMQWCAMFHELVIAEFMLVIKLYYRLQCLDYHLDNFRYPPTGLDANMTISTPFTRKNIFLSDICLFYFLVHFDKMGLTDNQNPFGIIPQLNSILGKDYLLFSQYFLFQSLIKDG